MTDHNSDQHSDKDDGVVYLNDETQDFRRPHWWRNTYTQAIITGIASFLGPGMYAALAATGAGGLANVEIGNASVAIAYGLMVPSALMATGFISKFNCKLSLALGAAGYAPYSASLYTNSAFGNQWFILVGAVLCGLTSGVFWATEGAIIMNYSEPQRKGRLLAIWQSIYTLATVVGGCINLALNVNMNQAGGLQPKTYLVFVALSCVAPMIALLLSNPQKVQRADNKPVPAFPKNGFLKELWLTILELRDPRILACAFLWSQSLFIPSLFSTYRAKYFTVRVRGMSSIVVPCISIIWFQLNGLFLDSKIVLRKKLLISWSVIQTVMIMCAIWVLVDLLDIEKRQGKVSYDWTTPRWGAWWVASTLGQSAAQLSYGYNYYMATFVFPKEADGVRTSRIIATLRSAESGSAAIAFGIAATKIPLSKIAIINLVFLAVILALGAWLLQWIWKADVDGVISDGRIREEARPEIPASDK